MMESAGKWRNGDG